MQIKNILQFIRTHRILSSILLLLVAIVFFAHASPLRKFTINRYTKEVTGFSISAMDDLLFPENLHNREQDKKLSGPDIERIVNAVRKNNGLPLLNHDDDLTKSSDYKLANMIKEEYFGHKAPSGKMPWGFITAAGYKYDYVGENLATGNFANENEVVQAWLDSPAHKAILLDKKFCDIGVSTDLKDFFYDRINADIVVMHVGVRSYSTLFGSCQDI